MEYNATLRNISGDILTFLSSLIINILTIPIIIYIELKQSDYGKLFKIEKDDIIRRTIITIIGSITQIILISNILNK